MSSDIGQDILSSVRADFAKALDDKNGRLGKLFRKIQDGSASMSDISTFSVLIGQTVSSAVGKQITQDVLPDGTLYYNIAQTVLQGVLKDSYELINLAAQTVQERLDSEHGLHIKPVKPDFPEERIRDIAGAASTASMNKNEEKEERRLTSPVENVVQSFYSDYVRENADLRSKAGLNAYIIRRTNGNCCRWCADLAGRYRYEDAPADVYARHDNCTCTVDFVTNNYRQDVWSKRKYSLSPEERRKALEAAPKPTRYTREQAKNLQDSVLNRVANSGESGIINIRESRFSKYLGQPIAKRDNQHVREWYYANVSDIPNQIDKSKPYDEQVKQAFELRNQYKREARIAMSDVEKANELERLKPIPKFEELLRNKMDRKGLTRDEALKDILDTASKTNPDVNQEFDI